MQKHVRKGDDGWGTPMQMKDRKRNKFSEVLLQFRTRIYESIDRLKLEREMLADF